MDIIGLLGRQDNHHWGGILEFQIWETLGINNVKVATSSQQLTQVNSLDISCYRCIDNHYWPGMQIAEIASLHKELMELLATKCESGNT